MPDSPTASGDSCGPAGPQPLARRSSDPYTGDIEIRIHGVSGTPPEELLDRAAVEQVAGDRVAGFYRPAVPALQQDRPRIAGAGTAASGPGPWLEGYSWGGWTSGVRSRALWLALLPFALVNVAPRMLPPPPRDETASPGTAPPRDGTAPPPAGAGLSSSPPGATPPGATPRSQVGPTASSSPADAAPPLSLSGDPGALPPRTMPSALSVVVGALFRLLALSLTVTMVLGVAIVAMVTVAGRCAPSDGVVPAGAPPGTPPASVCSGLPGILLNWLDQFSPAGRVGLLALAPMLLVGVLWLVSRRADRYQPSRGTDLPAAAGHPEDDAVPLRRPDLWRQGLAVRRLRLVHIHVGLGTCAWVLAWVLPSAGLRPWALTVSGLSLIVSAGLAIWRPPVAGSSAGFAAGGMGPARAAWALVLAALALDVALILGEPGSGTSGLAGPGSSPDPDRMTTQADLLVRWLFTGQGAVLVLIGVCLIVLRVRGYGRGRETFMAGFGSLVFGTLAWLLGSMFTASVLVLVPAWLSEPGFTFTPGRLAITLSNHPNWFGDTTRSAGIGMAVGIAAVIILLAQLAARSAYRCGRWTGGGSRTDWRALARDYPDHVASGQTRPADPRARQIGSMFWLARRVDRVPRGIVVFCVAVALLLLAQLAAIVARAQGVRSAFLDGLLGLTPAGDAVVARMLRWFAAWGVFLVAGLLVALVAVGVAAYRSGATRRGVGVLWDLACFWPRTAHPFAPPCYNERIVPEVTARTTWYVGTADRPGTSTIRGARPAEDARGRVVIAGHSQGSVISLAVVLLLPPETRARVALVTFGCVVDRLYARLYPQYFGPEVYTLLASELTAADGPARWVNLWRHSDYLGGSIPYPATGADDPATAAGAGAVAAPTTPAGGPRQVKFIDPAYDVQPGAVLYPVAGRHSGFPLVRDFQDTINAVFDGPGW